MKQTDHLAVAKAVREIFRQADSWIDGYFAADEHGNTLGADDDLKGRGVKFCLRGARFAALGITEFQADPLAENAFGKWLGLDDANGLASFSNTQGQEAIVSLLDDRISKAQASGLDTNATVH